MKSIFILSSFIIIANCSLAQNFGIRVGTGFHFPNKKPKGATMDYIYNNQTLRLGPVYGFYMQKNLFKSNLFIQPELSIINELTQSSQSFILDSSLLYENSNRSRYTYINSVIHFGSNFNLGNLKIQPYLGLGLIIDLIIYNDVYIKKTYLLNGYVDERKERAESNKSFHTNLLIGNRFELGRYHFDIRLRLDEIIGRKTLRANFAQFTLGYRFNKNNIFDLPKNK